MLKHLFLFALIFTLCQSIHPQITVTGLARTLVTPTDVIISFTVKTLKDKANEALTENNRKMNALVDALKQLSITEDELATSGFSIQPQYDNIYVDSRYEQKFKGYLASQSLTVSTKKFELAGKLIDSAISSNDATLVNSVNFFVSESIKAQIKNDLIEKAVLDARKKANLALGVLNNEVANVDTLSVNDFSDGGWNQFKRYTTSSEDSSTNFFTGSSEISLTVSAVFRIKKLLV